MSSTQRRNRLYRIYAAMKQRCYNKEIPQYKWYGAKGITVCSEWLNDTDGFKNFVYWALDNGYDDTLTIDRIDNTKGYFSDNCRWITKEENTRRIPRSRGPREKVKRNHNLSYKKLFNLLDARGVGQSDLLTVANISSPTLAKLSKGDIVTTEIIDKICGALKVQPGDIMEYVEEVEPGGD